MNWKKHKLPALLMLMIVVYSCASMGTPDGGPYDEEPPKFVRSSPKPYATNNKDKKIAIEFDEFIKLEKTSEKWWCLLLNWNNLISRQAAEEFWLISWIH